MEEYKPNSHKSKEQQNEYNRNKNLHKVVSGPVRSKDKNSIRKLADAFITEDIENVKSYILLDVIIPAVKSAISEVITSGIDLILYGETGHSKNRSSASKTSYRGYYDKHDDRRQNSVRSSYDYKDIILDNRGEAEDVLTKMDELVSIYGMVSVADLYDLVGITGNYTDNNYGWTDIRSAQAVRVRDGYLLKLPRALPF